MRQLCLLQSATGVCYKVRQLFYYKVWLRLLQSATGITKCDWGYYKVRQVLQSATVITKCDSTMVATCKGFDLWLSDCADLLSRPVYKLPLCWLSCSAVALSPVYSKFQASSTWPLGCWDCWIKQKWWVEGSGDVWMHEIDMKLDVSIFVFLQGSLFPDWAEWTPQAVRQS